MKKAVILLLLQLMFLSIVNAGETFNLTKQGAHYVFTASINGKADATILVDFGNPELFFLIYQTEAVQQFLADNADMDIRDIKNPRGEVVLQAIFTKQCQLCGITFPDAVVAMTKKLPLITTPGNIGLKFFERVDAILDFDKSKIYLKKL